MLESSYITAHPTEAVVTVAEVREHARIDSTHTDELIRAIITAAERTVEHLTRTALLTQTRTGLYWSVRVLTPEVCPGTPVQSMTVTRYTSESATESVTVRRTDGAPAMWYPPDDGFCYERTDGSPTWTVSAVCGYADKADIPAPIRHAILLLCGHLYDHPELVSGEPLKEVPFTISLLLGPYTAPIF